MTDEQRSDNKRICIIEDEPAMVELMTLILKNRGFDVVGAIGGQDGLEMIRQDQPDLVLLDLMMPDMSGWDVYQHMKADDHMKEIPVIIVTAKAQSIDKVLGLHIAKVQDYITKPFTPNELVDSIRKVLSGERRLDA